MPDMSRPCATVLIDSLIYQLRSLRRQPAAALNYVLPDLHEAETLIGPAAEFLEEHAEQHRLHSGQRVSDRPRVA